MLCQLSIPLLVSEVSPCLLVTKVSPCLSPNLLKQGRYVSVVHLLTRAVRSGAAGAARAAPLFMETFVIIARVHTLLSGATPH